MYFYCDKVVEGVAFAILFQNIPIHYMILPSSMLRKEVISTITTRIVYNTGGGGVFA